MIAIFAYLIAPDNTPNADLQMVEIQAKPPGFTQTFIVQPSGQELKENPFTGTTSPYTYIPVTDYKIRNNEISFNRYIDEDTSTVQHADVNTLAFPHDPQKNVVNKRYWLGTDTFGRDILSRLIIGARVSLAVGLIAVFISLILGVFLGALAGYYRGWTDSIILWMINVIWSIPTLLLVFAITMVAGKGFWQIFIAVGLTMWVSVARLVRGQILSIREREYVQAAKALGYSDGRIILRHVLPNIKGPLIVIAASNFATAIIIEAGLSFLGIGVQPPQPSWGLMIRENYTFIITDNPVLAIIPGIAIMMLVLSFNLVGNALRDIFDVRLSRQ
jgi:peptide/nickel transport system permease protein